MSKIKIGNDEVELDGQVLEVSHETINEFLTKFASWYRYYQEQYNRASIVSKHQADKYNSVLHGKFKTYKQDNQCSDKMAEACAKSDEEVLMAQEKMRGAEYVRDEVWGFLRSMDYAHENALQLCYNMRKEIDKIGGSRVNQIDYQKLEEMYSKNV